MTDADREEMIQRRLAGAGAGRRATIPRVPRGGPLPLSFGQRRLWVLDRIGSMGADYLVPTVMRMPPSLDPGLTRRAWEALVARHEVLRTRYVLVDEEPMQVVDEPGPIDFEFRELSTDDALLWAAEVSETPFALATQWPVRVRLARLPEGDHLLVVVLHHIACDAWSNGVLGEEFGTLYAAYAGGGEAELPSLPVQYADYAVWQRDRLTGELRDRILGYWREQLEDLPRMRLPLDRPRPQARGGTGGTVPFRVPAPVAERLRELGKEHEATLFMVLLAAFQALLGRHCGTRDVVVGTAVCGRTRPEVDRMVGFLVNTLVIRSRWGHDTSFAELVEIVRGSMLGALDNQDLPFERLVEELQAERDPSRMPLFDVMFGSQTDDSLRVDLDELAATQVVPDSPAAKFDLSCYVEDVTDGSLLGRLEFATAIFDRATIEGLAARYVRLLALFAADQDTLVALADMQESGTVLTGPPPEEAPLVLDTFEAQARATPDAVAIAAGDVRLTYAELDTRANGIAHLLRERGAGPESVVGVRVPRGEHLMPALLGVWKAGAAYLPLDLATPPARLARLLSNAGARILLAAPGPDGVMPECVDVVRVDRLGDFPVTAPARVTDPDQLAYVIFTSGSTGGPKGVLVSQGSLAGYVAATAGYPHGPGEVPLFSSAAFDLVVPALFQPLMSGRTLRLLPEDLDLADLGKALAASAPYTFAKMTPAHLELLTHQLTAEQAAGLSGLLVVAGQALPAELVRRWRELAPATPLINSYGPTETTVSCFAHLVPPGEEPADGTVPIGLPMAGVTALILDAELRPVPDGVIGELHVGGPGLARGYLGHPGLTAERFIPAAGGGRLYRTGDLARRTATGEVEFHGRADDQVKIRGHRIEPGEIAAVLRAHPGVRDAVVVAHGQPGAPRLAGYAVPTTGAVTTGMGAATTGTSAATTGTSMGTATATTGTGTGTGTGTVTGTAATAAATGTGTAVASGTGTTDLTGTTAVTVADLVEHARRHLPEHMVPADVILVGAIPLTRNGKVDVTALPLPGAADAPAHQAPRTETEEIVAELWSRVSGIDDPGVHDDFFAAGGDSITAIRLIGSVRDAFEVEISFRRFFEAPTVAGLADAVEDAVRAEIEQMSHDELLAYHGEPGP
ncbi:hypothetical protein GCM10009555_059190 [Acrocarpospora macrocephala]|uniref:Carrier domain-containing protein n=1 Tax=Acrocarpospora macrocephala TaxID=150177 RepID=A0A5M3WTK8_9ACTN|nr:non-ribosomal peptide synthetase [Acrocarpospora macrocephala]GES11856.1 hypothetical protein Amac_054530 [Acrocarpospora macrocephala]